MLSRLYRWRAIRLYKVCLILFMVANVSILYLRQKSPASLRQYAKTSYDQFSCEFLGHCGNETQITPEISLLNDTVPIVEEDPIVKEIESKPLNIIPDFDPQSMDFDLVSPIADRSGLRYNFKKNDIYLSTDLEFWEVGVLSTRPNVFIAATQNFFRTRYFHESNHKALLLMKWILRVHRNNPHRDSPLVMVDVGPNDGYYSMVAGASGAHVIAIEPLMHKRSALLMSAKLNGLMDRFRVLPFAVFNHYIELTMIETTEWKPDTGGENNFTPALTDTWTIRLDAMPRMHSLYHKKASQDRVWVDQRRLDPLYQSAVETAMKDKHGTIKDIYAVPDNLSFRNQIHFMRIAVDGMEIEALASAEKLFNKGLLRNVYVEFGSPEKWDRLRHFEKQRDDAKTRERSLRDARNMINTMMKKHGFRAFIVESRGWDKAHDFMTARYYATNKQLAFTLARAVPVGKDHWDEFTAQMRFENTAHLLELQQDDVAPFVDAMQDSIDRCLLWFTNDQDIIDRLAQGQPLPLKPAKTD